MKGKVFPGHVLVLAIIIAALVSFSACSSSGSDDDSEISTQQASSNDSGNGDNDGSNDRPEPAPVVYPDDFLAGAAAVSISPTEAQLIEGVSLGGFGMIGIRKFDDFIKDFQKSNATGIHDDIYARAMVIEFKGNTFAIVTLDLCTIGNKVIRDITSRVAKNTGIPQKQVFVSATHSHASLDLLGNVGSVCKSYRDDLVSKSADAVISAYNSRKLARLYVSTSNYGKFDEKGNCIQGIHSRRDWPDLPGHPGVDRSLNVIQARAMDETPIGTLINIGCHPTMISSSVYDISRDFCGYLVDKAEDLTGAPVIFVQGALGDVSSHNWPGDDFAAAQAFGEDIAVSAVKSIEDRKEIRKNLYVSRSEFIINMTNIMFKAVVGLQKDKIEVDYDREKWEATTQVNYIRLGDELQIVTLPGEALSHLVLGTREGETGYDGKAIERFVGIKEGMSAPFKMAWGVTDDTFSYLVPDVEWNLSPDYNPKEDFIIGGYSESMCVNKDFARQCAENAFELMRADPW